jgi:hypothetical protein
MDAHSKSIITKNSQKSVAVHKFSFKRKISFKNSSSNTSMKLILEKAEYVKPKKVKEVKVSA